MVAIIQLTCFIVGLSLGSDFIFQGMRNKNRALITEGLVVNIISFLFLLAALI